MKLPADGGETRRVRLHSVETIAEGHYTLKRDRFDYRRSVHTWQHLERQTCSHGDRVVALLHDREMVLLTRQLRMSLVEHGDGGGLLTDPPGGQVAPDAPEEAIRREVEEETGRPVPRLGHVFTMYLAPTLMSDVTRLYTGEYGEGGARGGVASEGQDIEVLEMPLAEAAAMVDRGETVDSRAIVLLRDVQLQRMCAMGRT